MSTMNLRSLAKDYANGVLGCDAYRKARDELIEGILVGRIQITEQEFQAPLNVKSLEIEPDITAFRATPVNKPGPIPATAKTAPAAMPKVHATHRGILAGIAIIIACLLVLVALYPFTRQNSAVIRETTEDTVATMPLSEVQPSVSLSEGENLIKQFLGQNNWTEENLQNFISRWQELSAQEQDAGLSSPARTELANAIHRKLTEERAVQELGDASSLNRQTFLVKFARQIGISDPRLTLPDSPHAN